MKNKFKKIIPIIIWLVIWQLIYYKIDKEILVVSPINTFNNIFKLIITKSFWIIICNSMLRIFLGFLLAVISGVLIASLTVKFRFIYNLLYPIITIIKSTPVVSFIIITLVWIKSYNIPIFMAFLMVFPIIWSNIYKGIIQTDKKLIEMSKVFNFSFFKKILYIYIPSIFPYFTSACTTGIGIAWKSGIAAEVISIPKNSIGLQLYNAKIYIETIDLFSWTIIIILLSMLFEFLFTHLLKLITKKFFRFKESK